MEEIKISYFKQKCVLYQKQPGGTFTESDTIYDFYNPQINKGLADKQDTFQLNTINANNKYNSSGDIKFKIGDRIRVYMWKNKDESSVTNSDIIIDGFITKPTQVINDKGKIIQITGKNVLEYIFSTPIFLSVDNDSGTKTPYIIKDIVDKINDLNRHAGTDFKLNYIIDGVDQDGNVTSDSNTITLNKSDGTAITKSFKKISDYWKKANLLIEEYSQPGMTGDSVSHMAYVDIGTDGLNYFYWQPRSAAEIATGLTEGVEPSQIKTGYSSDIINAIIANCGQDPNNRGITVFVADYASINRHGSKWKYSGSYRNTAEDLVNDEINRDTDKTYFSDATSKFPQSYPYTTQWTSTETDTENNPNTTAGSTVTISSDDDWVYAVRREAKWIVRGKVKDELRGTFDPKFIVDVELPGIPSYSLGDYIPFTIPSATLTNQNLRMVRLSHSFWNTGMTNEEDTPEKIGVGG